MKLSYKNWHTYKNRFLFFFFFFFFFFFLQYVERLKPIPSALYRFCSRDMFSFAENLLSTILVLSVVSQPLTVLLSYWYIMLLLCRGTLLFVVYVVWVWNTTVLCDKQTWQRYWSPWLFSKAVVKLKAKPYIQNTPANTPNKTPTQSFAILLQVQCNFPRFLYTKSVRYHIFLFEIPF